MRLPRLAFLNSNKNNKSKPRQTDAKSASQPFHAVSIAPGMRACEAAYRMQEERFLSKEAPPLPLPGCDRSKCTCSYQHHADRRDAPRRDEDLGLRGHGMTPDGDRRKRGDRRVADKPSVADTGTDYFHYATGSMTVRQLQGAIDKQD